MKALTSTLLLIVLSLSNLCAQEQKMASPGNDFNIVLHSPDNMNYYMSASVLIDKDATAYIVYNQEQTPVKFMKAKQELLNIEIKDKTFAIK